MENDWKERYEIPPEKCLWVWLRFVWVLRSHGKLLKAFKNRKEIIAFTKYGSDPKTENRSEDGRKEGKSTFGRLFFFYTRSKIHILFYFIF